MGKNLRNIFHTASIAVFLLLFLSGCGYKGDPVYVEGTISGTVEK